MGLATTSPAICRGIESMTDAISQLDMTAQTDAVKSEVLARLVDDWVPAIEVNDITMAFGPDLAPDAARAVVVDVIAELIADGLVIPGRIEEHGFVAYELSALDVSGLVASVLDVPEPMTEYAPVWLELTPDGTALVSGR